MKPKYLYPPFFFMEKEVDAGSFLRVSAGFIK